MGCVRVAAELDLLVVLELQCLLETSADLGEGLLALLRCPALAVISFADRTRPEADTVEATPHVDDNAHDLIIVLVLEVLADRSKHNMEPEGVDVNCFLVLELEGPLSSMLILNVFPLGAHALLKQVVVRFQRELGCGSDVVLANVSDGIC